MPTSNKATDSFRTKSERGATETHTIDSLAERLLINVEAAHELISSGVLEPIGGDDTGERLKFQSDDLDAIRDAVVSATEDEVDEQVKDPKQKTFAVARALSLLQMASRESANQFAKARATEIRLSRIAEHHDVYLDASGNVAAITAKGQPPANIEFGIGGEIIGGIAKWGSRLLKRPGATAALIGKKVPGLADALKTTAVTTGIGAVAGGAKAAMDNDPNTGIVGGALRGSAVGALAGGVGSGIGVVASNPKVLAALAARKKQVSDWAGTQSGNFRAGWNSA